MWTIYLIVWVGLAIMSLTDKLQTKLNNHHQLNKNTLINIKIFFSIIFIRSVCLGYRCPEVLWLSNSSWCTSKSNQNQLTNPLYIYGSVVKPNYRSIYEKIFKHQNDTKIVKNQLTHIFSYKTPSKTNTEYNNNQPTNEIKTDHKVTVELNETSTTTNLRSLIMSIIVSFIYTSQ